MSNPGGKRRAHARESEEREGANSGVGMRAPTRGSELSAFSSCTAWVRVRTCVAIAVALFIKPVQIHAGVATWQALLARWS